MGEDIGLTNLTRYTFQVKITHWLFVKQINFSKSQKEATMTGLKIASRRPPGRELFFAPLEVSLSPEELVRVQFAYALSKAGHAKQNRKDGSRYFDHPKAVAWSYFSEFGELDPDVIIFLLLHDIQEDTFLLSFYWISFIFGKKTALRVCAVTKITKGKETFVENMFRIADEDAETVFGKCIDRLHNLRTLDVCPLEMQHEQIEETKGLLMPILLPALRSYGGSGKWIKVADTLEAKMNEAMEVVIGNWPQ